MGVDRRSILLKGVLDLCVLAVLSEDEAYGYELTARMQERGIELSVGSVYPLLARLEQSGDVRSEARASASGPPRRYWRLTASGRRTLQDGGLVWHELVAAVSPLLAPTTHDLDQKQSRHHANSISRGTGQ